jgi:hypothetical protein
MLRAVLISFVLLTSLLSSRAQILHYVYLQSENKIPFIVRLEGKRYVSSAAGYLLLSRLESKLYSLELRLLPDTTAALSFAIPVDKSDVGFYIKQMESGEWALVNLLTLEVVSPAQLKKNISPILKTDDAFTNILAEVVGTPSLREIPAPGSAETNVPVIKEDKPVIRLVATSLENNIRRSSYIALDDHEEDIVSVEMEYTIAVVPVLEQIKGDEVIASGDISLELQSDAALRKKKKKEKSEDVEGGNEVAAAKEEKQIGESAVQRFCNSAATQDDFFKLRKKMAGVNKDKAMLQIASRSFGGRCFTTEQVRNLSVLFLNDAGKLEFLEIAYPTVFDRDRFAELESLFSEVESKSRFRMITEKNR